MKQKGKVLKVEEEKTFGSNGFRSRNLVIEKDGEYPKPILFEFIQDNCDKLNGINPGDEVEISFNLSGREWINPQGETKYFNSIQGWKIDKTANEAF